jgi:hypothetical protein
MSETIKVQIDLDSEKLNKTLDDSAKNTESKYKQVSVEIEKNLSNSFNTATKSALNLNAALTGIGAALITSPPAGRGLYGTISKLTFVSGSMYALSEALAQVESSFAKVASVALKTIAVVTGGLAAAFGFAIVAGSEFAQTVGNKMVNALQNLRDSSNEFIASQNVLTKVIDNYNAVTGSAIGTTKQWESVISDLSTELNLSVKELNKSAQEIISVGSQIGLTADQMQKLTRVSAEYAKVNNKDVFETTIALINGLNGNSQAAQNLGIKLTEASVRAYAFKKGITESFESLSDNEKVQIRYNKLLDQYANITGIAANVAGQLADQENALSVVLEKLNSRFGQGVAIVENYNIVSKALGAVAGSVNETFVEALGFVSALGARFIQITGYIVEYTFKLFLLSKAIALYNSVTSGSITVSTLFNTKLKLINVSLAEMISFLTGGRVGIDAITKSASSMSEVFKRLFGNFLVFSSSGSLSLFASLRQVFSTLAAGSVRLLVTLSPLLLVATKIGAIIAAVVAAFMVLKNAFLEIEKRTKAFSEIWNILVKEISAASIVFEPILNFFKGMISIIKELGMRWFGLLVFQISKVVEALTFLAMQNPFNVFSKESISKLTEINSKLKEFSSNLIDVGFDISKIPVEAERAVASIVQASSVNIEALVQKLNALREQFKDFGLSDAEIIRKRESEALETLRLSYENKLLAEREYQKLRSQVIEDANNKIAELENKSNKSRILATQQANGMIKNAMVNTISGGIQNIVKSLMTGENVFKNFTKFVLSTFGDLAIQLGQFFIGFGIAFDAFKALGSGAAMVAAGAALVAIGTLIKGFTEKGATGGGGVASVGAQPGPGQFTTPDIANPETVERQAPNTNVSVTVQGSLVRQEELGQFITETLNESFAKQGVTLTDARFA